MYEVIFKVIKFKYHISNSIPIDLIHFLHFIHSDNASLAGWSNWFIICINNVSTLRLWVLTPTSGKCVPLKSWLTKITSYLAEGRWLSSAIQFPSPIKTDKPDVTILPKVLKGANNKSSNNMFYPFFWLLAFILGSPFNKVWVLVEWDHGNIYPYVYDEQMDRVQIKKVNEPRILVDEMIAVGCRVVRGE